MVLSGQEQFLDGIRAVSRDNAMLRVLFSLEPTIEKKVFEQCNIAKLDSSALDALKHNYARAGIELSWRMVSQELLKTFNSSWAKRLAYGRARPCVELTGRIKKKSM